jgi:transglutaminase-like putative cysteine protease
MTATLERPRQRRTGRTGPAPRRRRPGRGPGADAVASLRVAALAVAAVLPYGRVFLTDEWLVPLLAAAVLPVAVSFAARRLRARWWVALAVQTVAWVWFLGLALLPTTLWGDLIPTPATTRIALQAALFGVQRIAILPAPVYPEISLLVLAASGVWWVAASIDVLALRLRSPGKAVVCAVTLWVVPLAIVPGGDAAWLLSAPLILAAAATMLAQAERDFVRWGPVVRPGAGPRERPASIRQPTGMLLAIGALVLGVVVAGLLPGFGDPPWYELRARATTTLTDNPIVQLRTNLVASDDGPVMRVRSREPVYLRTTALDTYSEEEVWKTSGIEPQPLPDGTVPGGRFTGRARDVRVSVVDVTDGVLVPAPPGAVRFAAPDGVTPRYDRDTATFTFGEDRLQSGQRYTVTASRPDIDPDIAANLDTPAPAQLTALPDQVPDEVGALARRIVARADATSPFTQALAIQDELRSWEYSLEPPAGHSGVAMRTFLEQRVGYCEQFAGTMAVMLRTLDIPARVAVGFTPGTVDPDDPTLWTVSWANAHAWVEVKFGGEWIAFEPTPRADGNVLVPSVSDVTPDATAQRPDRTTARESDTAAGEDFDIFDEREALQAQAEQREAAPTGSLPGGGAGVPDGLRGATVPTVVVALLVALGLGLVVVGRRATVATSDAERVLALGERIRRLGRGLGVAAPPWETDHEYLSRLAGGSAPARDLAAAVTTARYAPRVDSVTAERAERAATALTAELLADQPGWRRTLIRVRGDLAAGWARVRGWLGRRA